jgi:cysteinyl-tRNA synthetase
MSKSLGNFFTLRDLLAKGWNGREIRYLLLTAHYRESFNFTLDGLAAARSALARIDECLGRLRELAGADSAAAADAQAPATPSDELLRRFTEALEDDLNVSAAWGAIFEWVRETNRQLTAGGLHASQAASALAAWQRLDSVLGIGMREEGQAPPEILALLEQRQAARKAKDFARADAVRQELKAAGWTIEDTPKGPRLKRV